MLILTSRTVVIPPTPCAPIPNALILSYSSIRNSSSRFCGPRCFSSAMSMVSIAASLAIKTAFSAVPPIPMPIMPGGHHPAPICLTVSMTWSTRESEGFSILSDDLFSDPPPLAPRVISTVSPGTISIMMMAGVLSFVFLRSN